MGLGLSHYARRYLADPEKFEQAIEWPLLLWEKPNTTTAEPWLGTVSGAQMRQPRVGEPMVLEVKKPAGRPNAFPMGVTLGRIDTNDICIEDASISRFHAYFQKEPRTGDWVLVDAESKNGTWVGPLRVAANARARVADQTRLRFGDIELTFMSVQSLMRRIRDSLA